MQFNLTFTTVQSLQESLSIHTLPYRTRKETQLNMI